jgi:predicted phosphodiesterase
MRIGIVGDVHIPFEHPLYLEFIADTFRQWRIDRVHFAGDVVDAHALSFHEHNPNGRSAEDEAAEATARVRRWYRRWPCASVAIGNHDARHFRVARKGGIPDRYVRTYGEVWNTPGWSWAESHIMDGVVYEHGIGTSGKDAAINRAVQKRCSTVIGHVHSYAGVKWHANEFDRIFGLNAGCGIDIDQYAFEYAKPFSVRPVLGCGIVLDGEFAFFEPMPCGRREKYHKSRARKARGRR